MYGVNTARVYYLLLLFADQGASSIDRRVAKTNGLDFNWSLGDMIVILKT